MHWGPAGGLGPQSRPGPGGCPDLLHPPAQTLYNKTLEALDQMLQSLIMQNPTADELHFLLSVRGGGWHSAGVGPAQARPRMDKGRCPEETGSELQVASGP